MRHNLEYAFVWLIQFSIPRHWFFGWVDLISGLLAILTLGMIDGVSFGFRATCAIALLEIKHQYAGKALK